jgi:hypothetical protein
MLTCNHNSSSNYSNSYRYRLLGVRINNRLCIISNRRSSSLLGLCSRKMELCRRSSRKMGPCRRSNRKMGLCRRSSRKMGPCRRSSKKMGPCRRSSIKGLCCMRCPNSIVPPANRSPLELLGSMIPLLHLDKSKQLEV